MKKFNTRQRTVLLLLPLFVLPVILAFSWAGQERKDRGRTSKSQLNTHLPQAKLEEKSLNKMELYQMERKAIQKQRELQRMDPYIDDMEEEKEPVPKIPLGMESKGLGLEESEMELMEKLEALQGQLNPAGNMETKRTVASKKVVSESFPTGLSQDVRELEALMDRMQPSGPDPEMEQLEAMLDKIMDIQHPERVKERFGQKLADVPRFEVKTKTAENKEAKQKTVTRDPNTERNGFYGLEESPSMEQPIQAAILAELAESATLQGSGRVKIKLLETVQVNGTEFTQGSIFYGNASQHGNRVKLEISSMRKDKHILPVELQAYDLDGMPGIPVSGSLKQEIQSGAGDALVSGMPDLNSGMGLETQMASAGVAAAKGLFRKKHKAVKITLKSGHPILLVNQTII
ncbi:conjugative transposon protein TraM [Echinicola sp. 20G]|uniref:conjugative transposon protein TraM n=1 Tax=Echinicola sp. 20G TaxID=2781961 RepID=UPI0019109B61|nr:conjugative transposon protein TraM [Echinicola sp. 20G]